MPENTGEYRSVGEYSDGEYRRIRECRKIWRWRIYENTGVPENTVMENTEEYCSTGDFLENR